MDKVYIETSIVSHATAWPSRDVTVAGLQQQARDWWENERHKFELVTSQLTLDESADGDPAAAADRLKLLHGLPLVDINPDVEALAARLIQAHTMPEKAAATLGGVNYLLTFLELQAYCKRPRTSAYL
jgi:hypothetical protein